MRSRQEKISYTNLRRMADTGVVLYYAEYEGGRSIKLPHTTVLRAQLRR